MYRTVQSLLYWSTNSSLFDAFPAELANDPQYTKLVSRLHKCAELHPKNPRHILTVHDREFRLAMEAIQAEGEQVRKRPPLLEPTSTALPAL